VASASAAPGSQPAGVSDAYKSATLWLGGVVLTLLGCLAGAHHDAMTKQDLNDAMAAQQKQIDKLDTRTEQHSQSLTDLQVSMGQVKEALGIDSGGGAKRRR
jgi:hypothetical protein